SGVDQVAGVGVARVHGQAGAVLDGSADVVDVGEVQLRVHALRVQVQGKGDQVDVAGSLPVPEQAALHAVGAGHLAQFGGRDGRAAVVVGVQRDRDVLSAAD